MRFGAVPIPLYAVQRYVPLLFLLFSRTNWFPVPSTPLSLPLAYTLFQVMFGVGSPSAIHSNVTLGSPSTTTTSLLKLLNSGGSVKELKTNKQLYTLSYDTGVTFNNNFISTDWIELWWICSEATAVINYPTIKICKIEPICPKTLVLNS